MHLRDAHQRVMSVAAVQRQLLAAGPCDPVYIGPYLSRLSQTLAASMTDDSRPISLEVQADGGTVSSAEALSVGLIVAELVINAFKHAFIGDAAAGVLVIAYEAAETSWRLTVSETGLEPRRANRIRISHVQDWARSSSRHLPSSLTLAWKSRGADAARRCRSPMERRIAPGFRWRAPG